MAVAVAAELRQTLDQALKRAEAVQKAATEAEARVSALHRELETSVHTCSVALLDALGDRRMALIQQTCASLQKALSIALEEKAALSDRLNTALEQTLWLQTEVNDLNYRLIKQARSEFGPGSESESKSSGRIRQLTLSIALMHDSMNATNGASLLLLRNKHRKQIQHSRCVHVLQRKGSSPHAKILASEITTAELTAARVNSDELEELKRALEGAEPTLSGSKQSLFISLRNGLRREYGLPLALLASSALAAIAIGYILKQPRH